MSVSSVTSTQGSYAVEPSQKQPPAHQKTQFQAPKDTVQLSAAAKAALGDQDHDGDSH